MRTLLLAAVATAAFATGGQAQTPKLPSDAVQLKGDEIGAYMDGKRFSVVIYDAPSPIKATVNWDLARGVVFGDFVMDGNKGTFENPWVIKGDTSCGERTEAGAWVCQRVFVKGNKMYEVNKQGKLHAVSTLK